MQVRSGILTPFVARGITLLSAAVVVTCAASTALAAGVVGTGTAASCTDAALNAALAGGGFVTFNCGTDPVTIDISTGTGTKTIADDTTIDGGGLITISGENSVGVFRVNSDVTFSVKNLTIANGHDHGDIVAEVGGQGGGIRNEGTLTVTNSNFAGNSVDENIQSGGSGGGAIYNVGTLTVANSTFTGNTAPGGSGGGISNNDGTLTVANSTIAGNTAGSGGGIFNCGAFTVTKSTFTANRVEGSILDSNGLGGAIANCGASVEVANSTFTDNAAPMGGGIANNASAGSLIVTNSTFSDNSGGGIFGYNAKVGSLTETVTNSTFTGSGIFGPALLRNTIVANSSSSGNCGDAILYGAISDGGHNLDDGTSCGFSASNGSLSDTDPQLDPAGLQDNGGPTETVALCTGVGVPTGCTAASPAIDAGDPDICGAAPVDNRDQRGFARPGAGHAECSIGAYEPDATAPEPCVGDCNGSSGVTIDELVRGVSMLLSDAALDQCQALDCDGTGRVTVDCLVRAVNSVLNGCGILSPTPTPISCGGTADGGCLGV